MKWWPLLLAGISSAAAADNGDFYTERPLDFSLGFEHRTLALDYGGATVDTAIDRIGVVWRERFGDRLDFGLIGGYSYLTQTNNAATAGIELNGYHAGVSFDLDLLAYETTKLTVQGMWVYQRLDHDDGSEQVVISWRQAEARLVAATAIGGGVNVYGGLRYGAIDGEQRLSGTVNETRTIQGVDRTGGVVGLELRLERNGYVGISAASGVDRGVNLYFGRVF